MDPMARSMLSVLTLRRRAHRFGPLIGDESPKRTVPADVRDYQSGQHGAGSPDRSMSSTHSELPDVGRPHPDDDEARRTVHAAHARAF